MRKKLLFEFPDSEMIEVKLETGILTVSVLGNTIQDADYEEWEEL